MNTNAVLSDSLRDVLGQIVAEQRREWRREREVMEAQSRTTIAELNARIIELERRAEIEIAQRLVMLKDGRDGERGDPGEPGPAGEPGRPGSDGRDGVDGVNGTNGADGKDGSPGPPGDRGEPGPQGERGERGERGEPGPVGERGESGERGTDGKDGEKGERGEPGERGLDGKDGERGLEGPPGKLPIAQAFVPGKIYYESEVVYTAVGTFQAARDTAKEIPHEDWIPLATRGMDGVGITHRGTYQSDESYYRNDEVMFDGSMWRAIVDNPQTPPGSGESWKLAAGRGKTGKPGERGPAGSKGERGERGASFLGWKLDHDNYRAIPILDDGSVAEPLELRGLFEQFLMETRNA